MLNKPTNYVASLARGLRVIGCFSAEATRLTIADVAEKADLDRATARRCLLTLHIEGYADYDGKYFTLTPRILRLGMDALASLRTPQIVQPWLDQLSETTGQSSSVAILDGHEIVYIARAAQKRVMSIGLLPGSRLPAHSTSLGRVLLAALEADAVQAILERSDLTPRTVNSLTDLSDLKAEIARVKEQGYALVDQEVEIGLRSLAVPLYDSRDSVVAALNIGTAATHSDPIELMHESLPDLQKVQAGLRRIL